jgi:hypothetical protein
LGTAIVIAVLTGKSIRTLDLTVGSRVQATTLGAFTGLDPLADLRRQLRSALPDEDEEIEIEIEDEDEDADEPEEIEIDFDDTGTKDAREEDPR